MSQKKYSLDPLGSKNTLRILRFLFHNLNAYASISQISHSLGTSRSNVHRGLKDLNELGLLRSSRQKGLSLVRIDTSSRIALPIFVLFNKEELLSVPDHTRSILSDLFEDKTGVRMAILFGSQARLTATDGSDIDILIDADPDKAAAIRSRSIEYLPEHRIEIHFHCSGDKSDLPYVDAILFGIALFGEEVLFDLRSRLEYVETYYLVWRMESAVENMDRAKRMHGPGSEYFEKVAWTTLGEIESILFMGRTIAKKDISKEGSFLERVEIIRTKLSKSGDKIWLT